MGWSTKSCHSPRWPGIRPPLTQLKDLKRTDQAWTDIVAQPTGLRSTREHCYSSSRGAEEALQPRPAHRRGCGWWGSIGLPAKEIPHGQYLDQRNEAQLLADLLIRDSGATLDDMIAATGWLPHTNRAALTGLKKKGYALSSDKVDGVRTYRAVAPQ